VDDPPIQLAVLISGTGTTLANLVDRIADGTLRAQIKLVIASREGIGGIERARSAGLACEIIERSEFGTVAQFSAAVFGRCAAARVDLICMAGWLSLLEIPQGLEGRIMNIHPSLLPSFGGLGMYGARVHQSVLDHGCKVSGCTVHFVDQSYDHGPIISQRVCPVLDDDTPQTLADRVFEEEKIAYPAAIEMFRAGRLRIKGQRVVIRGMPT
jgi:phosphoribosylglycinamide formyltransferase 1